MSLIQNVQQMWLAIKTIKLLKSLWNVRPNQTFNESEMFDPISDILQNKSLSSRISSHLNVATKTLLEATWFHTAFSSKSHTTWVGMCIHLCLINFGWNLAWVSCDRSPEPVVAAAAPLLSHHGPWEGAVGSYTRAFEKYHLKRFLYTAFISKSHTTSVGICIHLCLFIFGWNLAWVSCGRSPGHWEGAMGSYTRP